MNVNRQLVLIVLLLLQIRVLQGQHTITSTCTGPDSLVKKYRKDADRLALRHAYRTGTTYTDSINLNKTLSNRYLAALLAVYNATVLPARDTVVKYFNLHTSPDPELNALNVKATPTLNWMQQLQSSSNPTTNPSINNLIGRYTMQFNYYQSTFYDVVIFTSDTNVNMRSMAATFTVIPGVISAEPETTFNDTKNISDSLNPSFIELTYSLGWGTCYDTCDYRHYWTFRVYNDCSIEYMGEKGTELFLGLSKNNFETNVLLTFPNPVSDILKVEVNNSNNSILHYTLLDPLGENISEGIISGQQSALSVTHLSSGIYYLKVAGKNYQAIAKFIKE